MGRKKQNKISIDNYKLTLADEKIIRRYVLLLSDSSDPEYLIRTMAYVFRTSVDKVHAIIASTSDIELCSISMLREKWKKRAENRIGYIRKEWREENESSIEVQT